MATDKTNKRLSELLMGLKRAFTERYIAWTEKLKLDATSKMTAQGIVESEELTKRAFNTMNSYINRSMYFLEFLQKHRRHPLAFEPKDALDFQMYLQKRKFTFRDKMMSNQYINQIFDAIRNMYDYFLVIGAGIHTTDKSGDVKLIRLTLNPFKIIANLPQVIETKEKYLTEEQIEEVFKVAQTTLKVRSYYLMAMLLGLFAGVRISEVVTIKKEDISVKKKDDKNIIVIKVFGKGMKNRETIYIDEDSTGQILRYVNKLPEGARLVPVSMETLLKFFYRLGQRMSFEDFTFHRFRHTFGHELAVRNVPIETIGKLMGHASLDTTRIYSRVTIDRAVDEIFK